MKKYQNIHYKKIDLLKIVPRILRTMVNVIETRIFLMISDLQESKKQIFSLLILIGLTLFCVCFSLMSLFFILISLINPVTRLVVMIITTTLLLLISIIFAWITFYQIKKIKLLYWTCKEFKKDSKFLEE
ncbi:MAG: phage holin family protein [Candidatus Dasytiphilus stammeri]